MAATCLANVDEENCMAFENPSIERVTLTLTYDAGTWTFSRGAIDNQT